jgi:small-conductance mechanosensitive channel
MRSPGTQWKDHPVDLHEQRQLETARQMAKVKARARPWRAIIALVLAAAAGIISSVAGRDFGSWAGHDHAASKIVAASTAAAFCLFAIVGVLGLAGRTRQALQPLTGSAHAAVIKYTIVLAGLILTLILTLGLFKVPVSQLIVGGALTTILIGIAAQQSLSNVFAGLVLILSRPFHVGDAIQFRSGAMGGLLEGTVTEIGITYLRLDTADGPMSLPNAQVLAAAVSHPAAPSSPAGRPGANGQQAAPATPGDAPAPGPAAPGGQQAGPAGLGLATSGQAGPAEKPQPAPGQQAPGGSPTQA